jgi:redox-sensitive bicupin YhaK (pirin superfamily)
VTRSLAVSAVGERTCWKVEFILVPQGGGLHLVYRATVHLLLLLMSCTVAATAVRGLRALAVRRAETTYPTGNKAFSVLQAFPAGFTAEEASPFLMLDHFGPMTSTGAETDPDVFPVPWHPHRGMDVVTYLLRGVGRHADSLGNRETYATPGIQYIAVGSGIEHAEGGGTPAGEVTEGFQIWLNVPSELKMAAPRYGTHPPADLPLLPLGGGSTVRLLAGSLGEATGPYRPSSDAQMADYALAAGSSTLHAFAASHDNCLVYIYRGKALVGGAEVAAGSVARVVIPAGTPEADRGVQLTSQGEEGCGALVFAGRQLKQAIAWHGPFVMTTQEEIKSTLQEYRAGTFLKVRAPWNFYKAADAPQKAQ